MRPVIVYYGKPEFYQELAEKVKANQMQKTAFQIKTRQQSERLIPTGREKSRLFFNLFASCFAG